MYITSKSDEPTFSSPGLDTFLDFEASLSICQLDTFSWVFHWPRKLLMYEMVPVPFLGTLQSLLNWWDQKPGSQAARGIGWLWGIRVGWWFADVNEAERWIKGELRALGVRGRSLLLGEKLGGKLGVDRRTLPTLQDHVWRDMGPEMPGREGWGGITDKESAISETSNAVIFLYIYCRTLDLYSNSSKPWSPRESTSKLYTYHNSPVECGCSATHLEEKNSDT